MVLNSINSTGKQYSFIFSLLLKKRIKKTNCGLTHNIIPTL